MAIFKLIENTNPILATSLSGCSEDMNRQEMKNNLIETMEHFNGIGLSANQIGINERVFVMISDLDTQETITCFNPKILKYSKLFSIGQQIADLPFPKANHKLFDQIYEGLV